ncbi:MAG: phosphate ABC transporter substrate-binding protein [Chromatiales bacterium]|nr:phosphate ABC transporter substrate-binding protein [Chromatiales bacterium]
MRRLVILALALMAPAVLAQTETPKTSLTWAGCGITQKAFMRALAEAYEQKSGVHIDIRGGGATKGIRASTAQEVDMGGTCRLKLEDEVSEANAYLEPVAWDALAVIVHKDNPVNDISIGQLKALYEGRISNWSELGGPNAPVELFVRRGKISGVGRTLRQLVFANYEQEFPSGREFPSTGPLEEALEKNIHAIGVTGISSARKRDVKILTLDGKSPNYENIKSGAYLLYRPLYIVYNPDTPQKEEISKFVQFAQTRDGKAIIKANGVVPYTEALSLIMKQLEQERIARDAGLYR